MTSRHLLLAAALVLAVVGAGPAAGAIQADEDKSNSSSMVVQAPATMCSRASSSTIIDQEKLSPVRLQVSNRPGGDSSTAAAYVMSKKNDPYVIAVLHQRLDRRSRCCRRRHRPS